MTVSDVVEAVEFWAPTATAETWDNVGLLAGSTEWGVRSVVVSVDLTQEALALAKKKRCGMIVTHHPIIFPKQKGLSKVVHQVTSLVGGRVKGGGVSDRICEAIAQKTAVLTAHTNFDRCALEVIRLISDGLAIEPQGRLFDSQDCELLKLIVTVPKTHLEKLKQALFVAGAGAIGNYDHCSFVSEGLGTYRGNSKTKPFLGKPAQIQSEREMKLEVILPVGLRGRVLSALRDAHPYEEIAYDLIELRQPAPRHGVTAGLGYGFWGDFSKPKSFSEIAQRVSDLFQVSGFWASEPHSPRIKRIAFSPGDASKLYRSALDLECDLLITGECGYHIQLDAQSRGMSVIELGHRESELFFLKVMEIWLKGIGLEVHVAGAATQKIWYKSQSGKI